MASVRCDMCGSCAPYLASLVAAVGVGSSAMAQVVEWEFGRGGGYRQTANNTQPTVADTWFVGGGLFTSDPADVTGADIDGTILLENFGDDEWHFELDFASDADMLAAYPVGVGHSLNITSGPLAPLSQLFMQTAFHAMPTAVPYFTGSSYDDVYAMDPSLPLSLTWNAASTSASSNSAISIDLLTPGSGFTQVVSLLFDSSTTGFVLPAGTLVKGSEYSIEVSYGNVSFLGPDAGGFNADGVLFSALDTVLRMAPGDEVYGFGGVLGDQFARFIDSGQTFGQVGGVLAYHNNGQANILDNAEVYSHTTFAPRFDESWTARIDVTVPQSYDSTVITTSNEWLGIGLVVVFDNGSVFRFFDVTLGFNTLGTLGLPGQRAYNVEMGIDDGVSEFFPIEAEILTGDVNGYITLSFDATTKVLTASSGDLILATADLDEPGVTDWGMVDANTFGIGLLASSSLEAISASEPLTIDNFSATILPPPPAACQADMTTTNTNPGDAGFGAPDGFVNGADLSYYVEQWFNASQQACVPCATIADMTTTNTNPGDPGFGAPDGFVNGADISFYVEIWLAGCP